MPRLIHLNSSLLFLCCSIYLGTGVSLVFFQAPLIPDLTVDNYSMIFVEPVKNATQFFTYMTIIMLITGFIMLVTEWFSGIRWVPVVVLLGIIAATCMTVWGLFPLNQELTQGVATNERLVEIFTRWESFNRIRVSLWALQWFAMMYYFYSLARQARANR